MCAVDLYQGNTSRNKSTAGAVRADMQVPSWGINVLHQAIVCQTSCCPASLSHIHTDGTAHWRQCRLTTHTYTHTPVLIGHSHSHIHQDRQLMMACPLWGGEVNIWQSFSAPIPIQMLCYHCQHETILTRALFFFRSWTRRKTIFKTFPVLYIYD